MPRVIFSFPFDSFVFFVGVGRLPPSFVFYIPLCIHLVQCIVGFREWSCVVRLAFNLATISPLCVVVEFSFCQPWSFRKTLVNLDKLLLQINDMLWCAMFFKYILFIFHGINVLDIFYFCLLLHCSIGSV